MSDNSTDHEATAAGWAKQLADQDLPARIAQLEQRVAELEQVLTHLTRIPNGGPIHGPGASEQR